MCCNFILIIGLFTKMNLFRGRGQQAIYM